MSGLDDRLTVVPMALGARSEEKMEMVAGRGDLGKSRVMLKELVQQASPASNFTEQPQEPKEAAQAIVLWDILETIAGNSFFTYQYKRLKRINTRQSMSFTDGLDPKQEGSNQSRLAVVVKLDIEGSSCRALAAQGAGAALAENAKIFVPYFFVVHNRKKEYSHCEFQGNEVELGLIFI